MYENKRAEQLNSDEPVESRSGRELIYAEEFKRLIGEHPGIIKSFLKLDEEIKKRKRSDELLIGDTFHDGDLSITIIDKLGKDKRSNPKVVRAYYMKAEIENKTFFIKSIPGNQHFEKISGGSREFISLQKAKKLLERMPGVEVIDFQLGYEDADNNRTYFISKWRNGTRLDMYLFDLKEKMFLDPNLQLEYYNLSKRVNEIQTTLGDKFLEIDRPNMLYDKETDKIIVYDTHLEK